MKKVLIFSLLIANLFLLNNCSSAPQTESNIVDKQSVNANAPGANTKPIENGSSVNAPVVVGNNTNQYQSNSPLNQNRGRLVNSNSNSNESPKTSLLPAPHNSLIATTMSDKGEFISLRIFKSDPQIEKMEKNLIAKKIKVFLKNGKVLEIAADKLNDFENSSPQEILIAVGLMKKPDESQTGGK